MRSINVLSEFRNKHVKSIAFEGGKYTAIYSPHPSYGMRTCLYDRRNNLIKEFEGSLRYIGENIFIVIKSIRYKFDRVSGKVELSNAGDSIRTYSIVIIKNNKVSVEKEITLSNLKFILLNEYNEVYYKIHENVLEVFKRDFLNDKVEKCLTIIIEKTKENYVEILVHDIRKRPNARELFGKILKRDGSMLQ